MRRRLRLCLAVGAAMLVGTALAGATSSALWLVFSRNSAAPGDPVSVRTGGRGALANAKPRELRRWPLRVFMVPHAAADQIRSPRDRRLVPVGKLAVDRKGNGRLRFATPNLPAGEYTTLIHCVRCARYSFGRTIVPGGPVPGPFRVAPFVRDCESGQHGELPEDWRTRAVHAGPLSLYPMPSPSSPLLKPGYYGPVKVLVIVTPGARPTLVVPQPTRGVVGLLYGKQARFGRYQASNRVADGLAAVTFEGCPNGDYPHDHFGGGFVVARPTCADLEVRVRGQEPMRLRAPFGRPC